MPWTPATLKAAYRLTDEDELIGAALSAAQAQELRRLGQRVNGGIVRYTWRFRLSHDWWHTSLGLPKKADELMAFTHEGRDALATPAEVFLTDSGYSIKRALWAPFILGTYTADVRLYDDTPERDMFVASVAMNHLNLPEMIGRGWKRILQDLRPPGGLPGRLPDSVEIIQAGTPEPSHTVYVGVVQNPQDGVVLSALNSETADTFTLPTWTGNQYIVFVREASLPITSIVIGPFDQISVFESSTLSVGGVDYTEWRSRRPWRGSVSSGASVRIS